MITCLYLFSEVLELGLDWPTVFILEAEEDGYLLLLRLPEPTKSTYHSNEHTLLE